MASNNIDQLIQKSLSGSIRSLSRLITQVENDPIAAREAIGQLYAKTGAAHVIGVTGAPGSGKSSLVTELAAVLRKRSKTVAILAVDPSSPFTGGALLGDRVRMQTLSGDKGVFIRSMASRGQVGGLAQAASAVVKVLDAVGFEIVILETVGAGQAEIDIADQAHTTIVVEAPGMGDEVQSIKAGILEIADVLVVNKADRPEAARTVKALKGMLHLGPEGGTRHHGRIVEAPDVVAKRSEDAWHIPVVETSATEQTGIGDLADTLDAHRAYLISHQKWEAREVERAQKEVRMLVLRKMEALLNESLSEEKRHKLLTAVAQKETDPYTAADRLFEAIKARLD
ncbi:MAG: methylmalonyl Co-A mutase-associated GTPase MeaB [Chloroflexota bacterium]